MTDAVTILRCALCKKPFSYIPKDTDLCRPGTRNQICTGCYLQCVKEDELQERMYEAEQ